MSNRHTHPRGRVVVAAVEMLARHGLNATSIREMTKRAEAPLGSTYHHFPGGKQQVVVEAIELAGAHVGARLERHLQEGALAGLRAYLAAWRQSLIATEFRRGCPVMGVAVEEPIDDIAVEALDAAAAAFGDWQRRLAAALQAQGHAPAAAARLATLIIASVEGVIVMCRAQRSIEPFDQVAAQLEALVATP
jgi:AcrR family transcriptional regulator